MRDETGISNARAQVIEGLYKFSKDWINGPEPKKKVDSGQILTPLQIQIINSIEQMDDNELIEVLTYIEKWGIAPETTPPPTSEPDFPLEPRLPARPAASAGFEEDRTAG